MRFFVWKVIYQGSLIFMIISRISFKMPFQIQPHGFSLVSTVKLQIASTYLCHLYISYHRCINKIISLEHRIKVYKQTVLKPDALIEYLHEVHEKSQLTKLPTILP